MARKASSKILLFAAWAFLALFALPQKTAVNESLLLCVLLAVKNQTAFQEKFFETIPKNEEIPVESFAPLLQKFTAASLIRCTNKLKGINEQRMISKFEDLISKHPIIESSTYLFDKNLQITEFSAFLLQEEIQILLEAEKQKNIPKVF